MNLPKDNPQRITTIILYIAAACAAGYVFLKYLFGAFLPFGAAFLLAAALRPAFGLIRYRTNLSRRICAALLVSVCGFFAASLIYIFSCKLYEEALHLSSNLSQSSLFSSENIYSSVPFFKNLASNPIAKMITKAAQSAGFDALSGISTFVAERFPQILAKIAEFLPSFLFACVVFVFSGVYFLSDYAQIKDFFKSRMSDKNFSKFGFIKRESVRAASGILKGYFLLFCMTFAMLLAGFFILGTKYAFILALLTAFVDILPLVGTGIVLIPWGLIELAQGNVKSAVILVCIFAVITVVRQLAEPAVLGKQAGLHPLASMFFMYIGFSLFGLKGMILAPAIAGIVKNVSASGGKNK